MERLKSLTLGYVLSAISVAASIFPLKDITERVCLVTSETGPGRGLSRSNERTIKNKKKINEKRGVDCVETSS